MLRILSYKQQLRVENSAINQVVYFKFIVDLTDDSNEQ